MVKPLSFKGDKKSKKRKHHESIPAQVDEDASKPVSHNEDDSWTMPSVPSELTGPVVIVLPTNPPTCVAADPSGNVFASVLENMIDGDPRTAEPHTVQQVWVASRIAGMAPNEVSFKASHGGYLSCDQYGILMAKREARGREETFVIAAAADLHGRACYQLQTAASVSSKDEDLRFLSANSETSSEKDDDHTQRSSKRIAISLRGDGEASLDATRLVLRMQERFRPQTAEAKETARVREKVGRKELEAAAGRQLTDEETKRLKRAKREGNLGEALLDVRAKAKHDKYA